ncbi:MAG: hypothetical protein KKF48_02620 [Nanoarchaeota archaeon]|nr:hypothetical protein [Nanoarchaeota archaeon]
MKLLNKDGEKRVRIIIGNSDKGMKGIKAPTKTITLIETNVEEVYKKLKKIFEDDK